MQPEFGSQLKIIVFEQGQDIPNRIEETIRSAADKFLAYINIIMFSPHNKITQLMFQLNFQFL